MVDGNPSTLEMSGSSDRCYYASLLPHGSSDRCYYASLLPQDNQRWYLVWAHEAYMYCIPPSGVNLPSPQVAKKYLPLCTTSACYGFNVLRVEESSTTEMGGKSVLEATPYST